MWKLIAVVRYLVCVCYSVLANKHNQWENLIGSYYLKYQAVLPEPYCWEERMWFVWTWSLTLLLGPRYYGWCPYSSWEHIISLLLEILSKEWDKSPPQWPLTSHCLLKFVVVWLLKWLFQKICCIWEADWLHIHEITRSYENIFQSKNKASLGEWCGGMAG